MKKTKLNAKTKATIYAITAHIAIIGLIFSIIYLNRNYVVCVIFSVISSALFLAATLLAVRNQKQLEIERRKNPIIREVKQTQAILNYVHNKKTTTGEYTSPEDQVDEYLRGERQFHEMDDDAQDIFLEDYDGD